MLKIIVPIVMFILIVYGISHTWNKANLPKKKRIATILGTILTIALVVTAYLIID